MNFTLIGTFMGATVEEKARKDGNGTFKTGQALIEYMHSYTSKGETVEKVILFPFKIFGRTAEEAEKMQFGQLVKVTFELDSYESKGKRWPDVKAVFINKQDATPASPQGKAKPDADVPF